MLFPISGAHISPIYLAIIGFLIGILGGFFGVGGSFIAGPALRAVGLDWNFAVGTDLCQSGRQRRFHRGLSQHFHVHDMGKPQDIIADAHAQRNRQRREGERGPFRFQARHELDPTLENFADDHAPRVGCDHFALGHFIRRFCWRAFQRISRRRRRLHPDAVDGLRAWNSNAPRGRHRFVRDHYLGELRHVHPRGQR